MESVPSPIPGKRWYNRTRDSAPEQRAAQQRGLSMAALVAEFMLWMTVAADRRTNRRAARQAVLMTRWMQMSGDTLKTPMPGVVVL